MINRKKELLSSINSKPYFTILSIKSIYPKVEKNLKKNFFDFAKSLGKIRHQNFRKDKIIEIKPDLKDKRTKKRENKN